MWDEAGRSHDDEEADLLVHPVIFLEFDIGARLKQAQRGYLGIP